MILAVLQARMSSRRLPGKVLKPILGKPMLARQIERVRRCRGFDALVVATSTDRADDGIENVAENCATPCYRGSLDDVLDRFYRAALPYRPSHVVRLTADCPLADWEVIDRTVAFAVAGAFDYGSNVLKPSWPDGLDVEVIAFGALEAAWREAALPPDREHVGPFITRNAQRFRLGNLSNDRDLSGLRWTVDEPQDFLFVQRVYEALFPANPAFTTADILSFLAAHPEVVALNADIDRNEGFAHAMARIGGMNVS